MANRERLDAFAAELMDGISARGLTADIRNPALPAAAVQQVPVGFRGHVVAL